MFGRRKDNPVLNQLRQQADPNTLSWIREPAQSSEGPEAEYPDDLTGEEAESADDIVEEYPEDSDEVTEEAAPAEEDDLSGRRAALRAELNREAKEYGLTGEPTAQYGPYGEDVARVLDELANLSATTGRRLADDWTSADPIDRAGIDDQLEYRYRPGKHRAELAAAEDAVASWLEARIAKSPRNEEMWRVVAAAATGAVDALILSDELDDADYGLLYGAWNEIVDGAANESDDGREEAGEEDLPADEKDQGEFGPNTDLVADFLGRLGGLSSERLGELLAFWRGQPQEDLRSAHQAAQEIADENPDWRKQIRAAQDAVSSWSNGAGLVPSAGVFGVTSPLLQARIDALPAVTDAATALLLADLLEPADAETLYAPWATVVGRPELPRYDDEQTQ